MRKVKFLTNGVYHIYNRGTDKRDIFCRDADRLRFIYSMHKFNNIKRNRCRSKEYCRDRISALESRAESRDSVSAFSVLSAALVKLVDLLYFVLMPNHFHLILQQRVEDGIAKFMQKLGVGYSMYFNKKYDRSGVLFQGAFKAIPIETESYLMKISQYIHLNPLELVEPKFRERGIKDLEYAKNFLRSYKWSSFLDYIGVKNFPFLIYNELHDAYFKSIAEYEQFVYDGIFKAKP